MLAFDKPSTSMTWQAACGTALYDSSIERTDISNRHQYASAYKRTTATFGSVSGVSKNCI